MRNPLLCQISNAPRSHGAPRSPTPFRSTFRPIQRSATRVPVTEANRAWIVGTDYVLELEWRWIPTTDTATQTGWDGTTGIRAFLEWARQKNAFRWIPDASTPGTYVTSYLVEPFQQAPSIEANGYRRFRLVIRNCTTAYDGY
jgi:hypothetical protein